MFKLNASIAAAIAVTALANLAEAQSVTARDAARGNTPATPNGSVAATNHGSEPQAGITQGVPASTNSAPVSATVVTPQEHAAPLPAGEQAGGGAAVAGVQPAMAQASAPVSSDRQPAPQRTYSYRFSATADVANILWRSGRGYDLFSDKDAAWRLGIGVGYDALRLPAALTLGVEAGLLYEPSSDNHLSPAFGSLQGSMSATTLLLGASLRWAWTSWLAPYGRLGLLATRISMDIDALASGSAGSSGAYWTRDKWTEGAFVGAGIMANLPPQNPVNFGVLVEGGLWLQRAVDIQLGRDLPNDAIATSGARIGQLENTGPYVRVAGVLRF